MCQSIEEKFLNHNVPMTNEEFDPLYFKDLNDSHCHPHDDIENLKLIQELKTGHVTIMGVRQDDWDTVSQVSKTSDKVIPCFGIHPWFSHFLMTEKDETKEEHYNRILSSPNTEELKEMIDALLKLDTFEYDVWYTNLKQRLEQHPDALVGEIGVDRVAKLLPGGSIEWQGVKPTSITCSIEHQIKVFDIQSKLARELDRSISVHCVQGQGHLFNYLKEESSHYSKRKLAQYKIKPNMLRMCLHSYGGAPGSVKQFLELKGFIIYVSFSVGINARLTPANKLQELIRAVPEDRLLIESDLNTPIGLDHCMIDITKIIAEAKSWSIQKVVEITNQNYKRFINI